jgi:hypothetical protein
MVFALLRQRGTAAGYRGEAQIAEERSEGGVCDLCAAARVNRTLDWASVPECPLEERVRFVCECADPAVTR